MGSKDRLVDLLDVQCKKYRLECLENTDKIADYLVENGVNILPCKIGDLVWGIRCYRGVDKPQEGRVSEMYFLPDMKLQIVVKHICRGEYGKNVFSTKREAEEAIRRKEWHR